MPPQFAPQ
jgi:hypothetical protein